MIDYEKALKLLSNGAELQIYNGKWIVRQPPFAGFDEIGLCAYKYPDKIDVVNMLRNGCEPKEEAYNNTTTPADTKLKIVKKYKKDRK